MAVIESAAGRFVICKISWIRSEEKVLRGCHIVDSWYDIFCGSWHHVCGCMNVLSVSAWDGYQICPFFAVHPLLGLAGSSVTASVTEVEDSSEHSVCLLQMSPADRWQIKAAWPFLKPLLHWNASSFLFLLLGLSPSLLTSEMTPQPSCMFIFGCESCQVHEHTKSCFWVQQRQEAMFSLKHLFNDTWDTSLKRCNVFTPVMICASYRFPDSHTKSLFGPLVVTRLHNVTGKNTRIS